MGSAVHLKGAINIVKDKPSTVSTQHLHLLFLGLEFIVDLLLFFAALFKC